MKRRGDSNATTALEAEGAASFSGHESFALRSSWLKKCVDAVARDGDCFSREDAMVGLGVGKNMVKAIRHWGLTTRVIEDAEAGDRRARGVRVSAIGRALFAPGGGDPYLEDPRTLWLLHWLICTHPEKATTWRWAFGAWTRSGFTRDELRDALRSAAGSTRATDGTLARDVDVFVRTYAPTRASRGVSIEDALDSPLTDLRLLREDGGEGRYEFSRGPKASLDDVTLGFAILEHWERAAPMNESLHVDSVAHGRGAPGRVLCLDEGSLAERLERAESWSRGALLYDHTAGVRQLLRKRRVDPVEWLTSALRGRAS